MEQVRKVRIGPQKPQVPRKKEKVKNPRYWVVPTVMIPRKGVDIYRFLESEYCYKFAGKEVYDSDYLLGTLTKTSASIKYVPTQPQQVYLAIGLANVLEANGIEVKENMSRKVLKM